MVSLQKAKHFSHSKMNVFYKYDESIFKLYILQT